MRSFKTNLEAKADHNAQLNIPPELMEAYMMQRLGWTAPKLRATPYRLIEQIQFIWHLENIAEKAANRGSK